MKHVLLILSFLAVTTIGCKEKGTESKVVYAGEASNSDDYTGEKEVRDDDNKKIDINIVINNTNEIHGGGCCGGCCTGCCNGGCNEVPEPKEPPTPPALCKNKSLQIWLDKNNDGILQESDDIYRGDIQPFESEQTAEEFYGYSSYSAHVLEGTGPVLTPNHSNVYFHDGADGLALVVIHNLDELGSTNANAFWDIETRDNDKADILLVQDDPNDGTWGVDRAWGIYLANELNVEQSQLEECSYETVAGFNNEEAISNYPCAFSSYEEIIGPEVKLDTAASTATSNQYRARWRWGSNSDGVMIGPFVNQDFTIYVNSLLNIGIDDASFYSSNGETFALEDEDIDPTEASSFIIKYTCKD